MKKLLVMVAAVSLCATVAWGEVRYLEFYPTKDAGINKAYGSWGSETWTNMGAISQCRVMKSRQHFLLMDFDWAEIEAFVATAGPGERPIYQFSMVQVGSSLQNLFCRLVISEQNDVDWVEGDGASQFTEFNWTDPDLNPAVTGQRAQSYGKLNPGDPEADPPIDPYWEPDLDKSVGAWPWGDFDGKRARTGTTGDPFWNSKVLQFKYDCNNRNWTYLDAVFMGYLLAGTTPDNGVARGFYTYDIGGFGSNGEAYTSDAGLALSPMIRVTLPEPATLLLIGLGGVGLLLRKRR